MTDERTPQELAEEALRIKPFRFLDAIQGRSYAEVEVPVYLDEVAVLPLVELDEEIGQVNLKIDQLATQVASGIKSASKAADELPKLQEELASLEAKRAPLVEKIQSGKYIITVRGFDKKLSEAALETSKAEYPIEYDEYFNPVTGKREKTEVVNAARNRLYTNLLWQLHIVKIAAPDGQYETSPALETVAALRTALPDASRFHLEQAIDKVKLSVDWYDGLADEVFLAKS